MNNYSIILLSFVLLISGCEKNKQKDKSNPNIILILTDGQGYLDVGFNGSNDILTPNFDNLAREGIVFSNELQVKEDTPPTILIHATDDQVVSPKNSILYYEALLKNKVPVSLHILDKGGHGFGLYQKKGSVKLWQEMVSEWFKQRGIL